MAMTARAEIRFSKTQAMEVAAQLGLDVPAEAFDIEQFRMGMEVEFEHGSHDPRTNVTDDDPVITGKIAWAHLNEFADYYTRLQKMEAEAEADSED